MASQSLLLTFVFKALQTKAGDVVVLETEDRLTSSQFDMLRKQFAAAKAAGKLPDGVFFVVFDHPMDIKLMPEEERRAWLDALRSSLGMRAVPL